MNKETFEFEEVNPPTYGDKENKTDGCLAIANTDKRIKTTDSNLRIDTSTCLIVDINGIRFVSDERYPWIEVQELYDNEYYKHICEIDEDFALKIHTIEDLKIVAMNWYFDNVEIVAKDL